MSTPTITWKITCKDEADSLSRIVSPLRRKGMSPVSLSYAKTGDGLALCTMEFEADQKASVIIRSNMLSQECILNIETDL